MNVANTSLRMPYPGLRPFDAEDQPLFFGREAQVSAMLRQLEDHRFVAVVGSSGSGKSSLVRAGLLPAMREGFLLGTTDWLTLVIKPGHQPYHRLVRALHRTTRAREDAPARPADDAPLTPDETITFTTIRRTDRGLLNAIDQLAISSEIRVMIVVDQFEELFAFRRTGVNRDSVASRDEAAAFVGMLLRSASEPAGRVWAILTLRSDFIGDCEAFLGLPEEISSSQFLVPRLNRRQMEEAILRPAAVEEGEFRTFSFEEGLVNRIINDAGDRPDHLPLMQHALMRTWKRAAARAGPDERVTVTSKDYETAGGIDMALSLHADAAWDEIKDDPKKANLAQRLFLLLCDVSPDGQITRRRPQTAEIQAVTGAGVAEVEQVVRVFQEDDRNFLLPPPPQSLTAETYLDISHEALLRQWRRFAGEWQERERRDASELRRIAELASLRRQGEGGLVPAQDLERIGRWKERVSPEWARRYVSNEEWDEALRFVAESQLEAEHEREMERMETARKREEEQRQKHAEQRKLFVYAIASILLVATVFSASQMVAAWNARKRAVNATEEAQEALKRPFLRTIGSSHGTVPTLDERESLWELASLTSTNVEVRRKVIDEWFSKDEKLSVKALRRHAQGLRAAVGLDVEMRKHAASKVNTCAGLLARQLEQENDIDRLSRLGSALAELATRMERADAESFATRGALRLKEELVNNDEIPPDPMARLVAALAGLAARVERNEAGKIANALKSTLEDRPEMSAARLAGLAIAMEPFLARMEDRNAAAGLASYGVGDLTARLVHTDADPTLRPPEALGEALAPLAALMKDEDVREIGKQLGDELRNAGSSCVEELWGLGPALAGVGGRMDSRTAGTLAKDLAGVLVNSEVTERSHVWSLSRALVPLAARMTPKDAGAIGQRLATAMKNPAEISYDRLPGLDAALAAMTGRMEPDGARSVVSELTGALANPEATLAFRLKILSSALAAAVVRATPKDAAVGVNALTEALKKVLGDPRGPDIDRLASLANALEVLAARMDASLAQSAADAIVGALENRQVSDVKSTRDLVGALAALIEQKKAVNVAAHCSLLVVNALNDPEGKDCEDLSRLGSALGRISPLIPGARQTQLTALSNMLLKQVSDPPKEGEQPPGDRKQLAELYALLGTQDLAEVLQWPFCVGEAERVALVEMEKKAGRKFDGDVWKFVAQAKDLGIKDLDKPAKRPRIDDAIAELEKLRANPATNPGVHAPTTPAPNEHTR
jgi:energy-coupling factor transporter ATP-binding protein EcfA2